MPHDAGGTLETSFAGVGAEVPGGFGLGGGLPGAAARFVHFAGADIPARLAAAAGFPADFGDVPGTAEISSINTSRRPFPADAVEYHNWQGGGGYGDPLDRDPMSVLDDVRDGRVSVTCAAGLYGVVVSATAGTDEATLDQTATGQARAAIRQARLSSGRPAAGVIPAGGEEWISLTAWTSSVPTSGELQIGEAVLLDYHNDRAACLRCGTRLGGAREDPRQGCLAEVTGTAAVGPARGQDYGQDTVCLVRYYCPGCARQLDASIVYRDLERHAGYLPASRVAAPSRHLPSSTARKS